MAGKQSAADESLPKSGRGRKAGGPISEAQRKSNEKARAAAAKAKKARAAERREQAALAKAEGVVVKPRWQQLEDGDLDVSDLTTKELYKRRCANNDGTWDGARHVPSTRLVTRMEAEFVRRMRQKMSALTGPAFRALKERLDDNDAPAQQFAAAKMVIEYGIGKVPEVVHIGAETAYDRLQQSAFIVQRGGGLREELEEMDQEPTPGLDNTGHQVVSGELEQ
jgi:hypothetical protein